MNYPAILSNIVTILQATGSAVGAYLSGSLVNEHQDDFSDIDLGIVSQNNAKAFKEVFSLRERLIQAAGHPIHFLEREWDHCRMIAALYSKSQFSPIGLEIDMIFSQLQYVSEQMPYASYQVIFDRNGELQAALNRMSQLKPAREIENELAQHLRWFPFYVHDALKADKRNDVFQLQALLEEIRKLIFFGAAVRQGEQVFGAKRAYRYLSPIEYQIVEDSYHHSDEKTIGQLVKLYLANLDEIGRRYQIAEDVGRVRIMIRELL
ncbi:MAG TPA: hypothetical protein VIO61_00820 [Anaerolineaceae bacterium]